jgi:MtN3 and saliva related transmembrane protein
MSLVNLVGALAALCSMASFAPQILKLLAERDARSVSLRTYLVTVTGFGLWIVYGVISGSWPVTASNSVCLAMSGMILALKLKFSGTDRAARRP